MGALGVAVEAEAEAEAILQAEAQKTELEATCNELVTELQTADPEFATSLKWLIDNSIEHVIFETFSAEAGGSAEDIDLVANGSAIDVTDENKLAYVALK